MRKILQADTETLRDYGAFESQQAGILDKIVDAIPFQTVPYRMKAVIAISEIISFASQFKRNIAHWDDIEVPVNTIGFVLCGSGGGKDSSKKAAHKCFAPGYELIESKRKQLNHSQAKEAAREAGEELWENFDIYKEFLKSTPPLSIAPSTGPGYLEHINDIGEHSIGTGFLYTGEYGDELATNGEMVNITQTLSEVYDLGDKDVKYTKGVESRSREVRGQSTSALMVSSPNYILYDAATQHKFNIAFMTKLARRAWFCFVPEIITPPDFESSAERRAHTRAIKETSRAARKAVEAGIVTVTNHNIQHLSKPLTCSEELEDLFETYLSYNAELADAMPNKHSTAVLMRRHFQWKALKLAGALAIFDLSDEIKIEHFIYAIRFCETLADDMGAFEAELGKLDYERFADYIQTIIDTDGEATMPIHEIKKKGFIGSVSKARLTELINSAASYDPNGVYNLIENDTAIHYQAIQQTEAITLSYKSVDNQPIFDAVALGDSAAITKAKNLVASTANKGLKVIETEFDDLSELLSGDFAYSPYVFKDGIRHKDNIMSGTKFLVFDVDTSDITASEAHFILSDINHHIALSSDASNEFKFRAIIELDSSVDIDPKIWREFYTFVAEDLGLQIDVLAQSQLFFAYSDRPVLSTTDADPYHVRDAIMHAKEAANNKPSVARPLPSAQKAALIADPLTTFQSAFECTNGAGSRELIKAAYYAKDLGMSNEAIEALMWEISDYWTEAMDPERMRTTILSQVRRW